MSVLVSGSRLFAGSNGYVYELNPGTGKQIHSLLLASRFGVGNYETRLATDGTWLFVGAHGYVYGVALSNWSNSQWNVGVGGTGTYDPVTVLSASGRLFAGSNGYAYELNPGTGKQIHSLLLTSRFGVGKYDTQLATDGTWLFVGTHGYVYGVALSNWSAEAWDVGVGGTGAYQRVSVLSQGTRLFAGSNGYVYRLDPVTGKILHSLLLTYSVGVGDFETRLATDGRDLYAGVHGYSNKVLATDFRKGTQEMLVTAVTNNAPSPVSATYTSSGGALLVQFAGSGYSSTANKMISANLTLDGVTVATASVFANETQSHKAFVPVAVLVPSAKPGSHTFAVSAGANTTLDGNDLFTITVSEFFLS